MTKDVLISIKGLQFETGVDESVEMIAAGEYFFQNGKHYVRYEEVTEEAEGEAGISKNTLKFTNKKVSLLKKGASNVHMVFEEREKNLTYYQTPFGHLLISIFTNQIKMIQKPDVIELTMEYDLEINQSYVSDCQITVLIMSKEQNNTSGVI